LTQHTIPHLKELNQGGIVSFYNVCIEELAIATTNVYETIPFNETQKIVVYNHHKNVENIERRYRTHINVAGSGNTQWNHWDLEFTNESIPITHHFLPSTPLSTINGIFHRSYMRVEFISFLGRRIHWPVFCRT